MRHANIKLQLTDADDLAANVEPAIIVLVITPGRRSGVRSSGQCHRAPSCPDRQRGERELLSRIHGSRWAKQVWTGTREPGLLPGLIRQISGWLKQ